MKHLYLAALSILICICADVQAKPFTTGCKWSYCYWDYFNGYSFTKYELEEPYELNGKVYYRLYCTTIDNNGNESERKPIIGIRESDGRVYTDYNEYQANVSYPDDEFYEFPYTVTANKEVLLYDFNLNIGDSFGEEITGYVKFKKFVTDKQTIRLENGTERYSFVLSEVSETSNYDYVNDYATMGYVISGIGNVTIYGELLRYLCLNAVPICPLEEFLNVYVEDGEVIYKAPSYTGDPTEEYLSHTTYKNDPFLGSFVTGISDATAENKKVEDNTFYDVSGRKIVGTPGKGLYIRNGKKVLVK